ncbi:MAG: Ig-like domain-containing protein [Candidatus Competibacteraceae bacterium]
MEPGEKLHVDLCQRHNLTDDDARDPPNNLDGDENGSEGGDKIVTFGVRPNAVTDTFNQIHTNVGISVPSANGVLTNDDRVTPRLQRLLAGAPPPRRRRAISSSPVGVTGPTAQGGLATVNADGSFAYDPPPAFTGTDNFFYHLQNANGDHVGQVNLNVAGTRVWFINDTGSGSANRGTLQNPFTTLAEFQWLGQHPSRRFCPY